MAQNDTGVTKLDNGNWEYRFVMVVDGKKVTSRKRKDEQGNPLTTKRAAIKARQAAMKKAQLGIMHTAPTAKRTVAEVYREYCEKGRSGKAYTTIRKQDSLWDNHLCARFGNRYIDEISVAEIVDYLTELYYTDGLAFKYVESFLKMFYLIFGQAYSRNYLDVDTYSKLCLNKGTKIHMPKMKTSEEDDIAIFTREELTRMDEYFSGSNGETAYLLGKYCGLRINECYGIRWENINLQEGTILIDRQMQYQDGLIKLVSLKTRNAKRTVMMNDQTLRTINTIREAMEQKRYPDGFHPGRKITFRYMTHSVADVHKVIDKHDGKMYTVSPYQLLINDGNYYLIGMADDVEDLRTYRIDRMRDVSILDESRNMRKEWSTRRDMKTYIRQTFSMFGGEQEKVTIRFENSLLDTVIDKFGVGFGAEYIPDGDNHFVVTTNVSVSDQFYAWVCGFGTKAQIISPAKVAKDFKQYLSDIANQY